MLLLQSIFMNRIDRISAILIQLQSKKIVKAQDIGQRFNISLRTVYRDIRTLEEAGVPVVGEAGVGYSLMDGYRLPPVMLTKEEATAFITAEKFIEKLTDTYTDNNYKSALYKIKAVLRSTEKDYLETISDNIEVLKSNVVPRSNSEANLQIILNSISEKNVLSLDYFANHTQENTTRLVEPVGIFYMSGNWYLIAYCRLRNDYRNFRVDRIKKISVTITKFDKTHPSLKDFLNKITKEEAVTKVIIETGKENLRYFGDQKYYNGFVSQQIKGNVVEMTFLTSSIEGFARWYLMFGDQIKIVTPPELSKRVKEILTGISGNLK
ncbi:MAG: YafY family transcriptional regulator [Bacteroidetes bacterium]|jgi:predicted DNA-binding transcriptional regulator YafY|nr:YafY family transcriptional regulator [Bacteroidota bacterium]